MDARAGRFASMDSWRGEAVRPSTLHKYGYVSGDPINKADPSGLSETTVSQSAAVSILGVLASVSITISTQVAMISAYDHINTRQQAKAAAIACAATIFMTSISSRSPCGLNPYPMVFMRDSVIPNITRHVDASISAGSPRVLHRTGNPLKIAANRALAMGKCAALATSGLPLLGDSCDEYPFASTYEGGLFATVSFVPLAEQFSQGGTLASFYTWCNIVPEAPGLQDFIVVPVLSAPRSFSCGRFSH
jgi:Deoxyribonuclease NucA/NucB